ncbi:MAG: SufD family Fe-S cluster assembly protein, partial [Alphaproteobacteria bacterium]|nr:SufD family Fe-S cluster assembly protein [Alphaproteobacteria bacterium]
MKKKLNKKLIQEISALRNEPDWLLSWRLKAFDAWKNMSEPHWAKIDYAPIDYDSLKYYNEKRKIDNSKLKETYEKMGLPEAEQRALLGMATDTVIDSKSVHTSYTEELKKLGIIFLPLSEAVHQHPDLVQQYLGTVVPYNDNFFAALNAAVFSDGTFVYIPKNVKCPIDLASYFRIETAKIGQFERTLIIAEDGANLSYMEGCSAPRRPNHQLHSGVVEIIVKDNAYVKYSTVQNWYAGDSTVYSDSKTDTNGILNFVTKRGK